MSMPQNLKRRTFLKSALAASAAGVAPFNILKAGPSPNSKLNIACIGVGRRGAGVADGMAATDNIVALCDVHEAWHKKAIAEAEETPRRSSSGRTTA